MAQIQPKERVPGYRCDCGHFCARPGKLCCRCHNPANKEYWMPYSLICPICKGTMRKHPDGCYFQRCLDCGKVCLTIHKGIPVCAPMARCGDCEFNRWQIRVSEFDSLKDKEIRMLGCLMEIKRYQALWENKIEEGIWGYLYNNHHHIVGLRKLDYECDICHKRFSAEETVVIEDTRYCLYCYGNKYEGDVNLDD